MFRHSPTFGDTIRNPRQRCGDIRRRHTDLSVPNRPARVNPQGSAPTRRRRHRRAPRAGYLHYRGSLRHRLIAGLARRVAYGVTGSELRMVSPDPGPDPGLARRVAYGVTG